MPLGDIYSTGTASVTAGSTAVTGAVAIWSDVIQGDEFRIGSVAVPIASVGVDFNTLTLAVPWPGATATNSAYLIDKRSVFRLTAASEFLNRVRKFVTDIAAAGLFLFVVGAEPDPQLGEEGQYALKTNGGAWKAWIKTDGVWVLQATPAGTVWRGTWNSATAYIANDVVERNGTAYISKTAHTNQDPLTNPDDWDLFAAAGDDGGFSGIALRYTVDTSSTADADPGPGKLRLNAATQNTATQAFVDLTDKDGVDVTALLTSLGVGTSATKYQGQLQKINDPTKWIALDITAVTTATGYRKLSWTVTGASAELPFVNGDALALACVKVGDKGDKGDTGQGIQPDATGTLAQRSTYDTAAQGFTYLRTDSTPLELYFKTAATSGAWSAASPLGNASLSSPAFVGTPTAPTAGFGTNTQQLATTGFVQAALSPSPPEGRLTASTGVPVVTSTVIGATSIYYTPYVGRYVPLYDGTKFVMTDTGGELSQALTDTTKSPVAAAAFSVYDLFVWNDSGTIRCTRGPAWTNKTTRSTGTALVRVGGFLLNNVSITNGPAAQRGLYVGTVATDGVSKVNFAFGFSATGGGGADFGVWNTYNRVDLSTIVIDLTNSWSLTSPVTRSANGSDSNRVTWVCGLSEDVADAFYQAEVQVDATGNIGLLYCGVGLDSNTTFAAPRTGIGNILLTGTPINNAALGGSFGRWTGYAGIGQHFVQAMEFLPVATTATVFAGGVGEGFYFTTRM